MSCDPGPNDQSGFSPHIEPGMESDASSAEEGSSAEESGSSSRTPSSSPEAQQAGPPPEVRRANVRCVQPTQRFVSRQGLRPPLTSVACQTDYTDEWTPMSNILAEEASSSSEGTLRLLIQNFRSMADTVRGPSKEILGVQWRIMVMPRQHVVQKKGTQKCLGFFLQCCPEAYSESWSCQAQAELRLISQKSGVPHFTRKTNHNYTAKENDWGYSCFMTWADILDESQGYIKEDRVILEVTVKAEPPKNIMSREDFRKRIDQWKELAEMHCNRNCIDLAIEANSQAIKFCKDRDPAIKAALEERRKYFIEKKVQESIQRIEKGKDTPAKSEEETTSQFALKQALHQSTKNMARKGSKAPKGPAKQPKARAREPSPSPDVTPPASEEVHVEDKPKMETAAVIKNAPSTRQVDGKLVIDGHFGCIDMLVPSLHKTNYSEYVDYPTVFDMNTVKDNISWARRSKEDESFYNDLALTVQGDFEKLQLREAEPEEVDYNAQLAAYDRDHQQMLFERIIERNFLDACERRKRRQINKTKGQTDAKEFTDTIAAERPELTPDDTVAMDEVAEKLGVTLDFIADEASKNHRAGLLDVLEDMPHVEPCPFVFVSNTPWLAPFDQLPHNVTLVPPPGHLYPPFEQFAYDDAGSDYSSDSERQTDGCIKAKRTRLEKGNCYCADHSMPPHYQPAPLPHFHPVVEIACQTEDVICKKEVEEVHDALQVSDNTTNTTSPQARLAKKTKPSKKTETAQPAERTQEKLSAATNTAARAAPPPTATSAAATNTPNANDKPPYVPEDNMINFGTFKVVAAPLKEGEGLPGGAIIPRILPMEYAMKFFPNRIPDVQELMKNDPNADPNKIMEEWVRSWLQEAQKMKPNNGTGPIGNPQDFIAAYSDQVVSALSAVALNFMNVRRLTSKVNELIVNLQERTATLRLNKLHSQIFNMAGMAFEQITDPVTRPLPDTSSNDGDYVLIEQITYLDDIKGKLDEQIGNEKDLAKKIGDALKKIDERLRANDKTIEDQKKKIEDQDKSFKKLDKSTKQEIQLLKNQLTTEKDRYSTVGKELKERNKEVKRLETRCNTVTAERDDYTEKAKSAQKEITTLQKKHTDEINKLRREMASLNDSRKNLQNGIAERDNENKSLQHQVEEKNNQLKRLRADLEQEKQKATSSNRELEKALERARRSEIDLLSRELESGVSLLERAHSDATKHCNEMEEAASNRARNPTEVSTYMANKIEWANIVEQIEGFIKKAKADYASHIDAIQGGKSLAALPKIAVAKPPMPPAILKVAPIVPIEPSKTPGPIGPPRAHPSTMSPPSRSAPSPIPKRSPSSPVRHPGAIGTRPNGAPINGSSSSSDRNPFESTNLGSSLLNNWSWSEPLESILSHTSPSNDLLSMANTSSSRVDQNGWDEQNNTWSNNHISNVSNVNQYISGPLGNQSQNRSSLFGQPPGWSRPHSAQHQPINALEQQQQQRMMIFNQIWQPIIERVAKKLHIDMEQAFQLARQYVHENNVNLMTSRMTPEDIADAIFHKRYSESSRLPPGAAPGYLQSPLMGSFMDRSSIPPLGSLGLNSSDHLLNNLLGGDSIRPSSTNDKWSNGM